MNDTRLILLLTAAACTLMGSCASFGDPDFDIYEQAYREASGVTAGILDPPESGRVKEEGPLEVTVPDAILVALENNKSLSIQRYNPRSRRESLEQQRAAFDPALSADLSGSRSRTKTDTSDSRSYSTGAGVEFSRTLPSGTTLSAGASTNRNWSDLSSDSHSTGVDLTFTQALLQGRGASVNLASLRQAKLDVAVSHYELRGFAESLVGQVETTYWDFALARRQIEIYTDSLKLAEQQLAETQERVRVGKLAETELAAARANVAQRNEDLINARSNVQKIRLQLLRFLNPPGSGLWDREIILQDEPAVPEVKLDAVEEHVKVAMLMRPDLNQARLSLARGRLEVVKTKNGLLPRLDLFITLGKTGYAASFHGSVEGFDRGSYNYSAGLSFEFPLGNRAAKARHRQALLSLEQAQESIENMRQLVEMDVRSAYIEVNRAAEQVTATAATLKHREETLRNETEKFRVGKSTSLLVAQAQRDLVVSQVSEIQAIVSYLKALVELFQVEGSLLERRGLSAPGREPADAPGK